MWDFQRPGIEPTSFALASKFLTIETLGKSLVSLNFIQGVWEFNLWLGFYFNGLKITLKPLSALGLDHHGPLLSTCKPFLLTSSLPPHPCAPQTLPLRVCKKEEKKPVCPQNTKAGVLYDLGIKEQIHEWIKMLGRLWWTDKCSVDGLQGKSSSVFLLSLRRQ